MRRRLIRIALILLLFPPLLAAVAGWLAGPAFLHPLRRELTPDLLREADASFAATGATREDFDVRAPDGALLRGWKVRPKNPNGSWVLVFHGVADNRVGVIGQSEFLLRAGYSVVMMDARAHGASGGPIATYGWLERNDTRSIIDALLSSEHLGAGLVSPQQSRAKLPTLSESAPPASHTQPVHRVQPSPITPSSFLTSLTSLTSFTSSSSSTSFHIFALGESMGAGIVLQSAGVDPRIEAVVAEVICDEKDVALPCRHSEMIYAAARGPKQLWVVPRAFHTAAYGFAPEEFRRRVLSFFAANTSRSP